MIYQNSRVVRVSHIVCLISFHSGRGLSYTFDVFDCHNTSYNAANNFFNLCPRQLLST